MKLSPCEFCFFNPNLTQTKGVVYRVKSTARQTVRDYISFLISHHNYTLKGLVDSGSGWAEYIERV